MRCPEYRVVDDTTVGVCKGTVDELTGECSNKDEHVTDLEARMVNPDGTRIDDASR